MSKLYAGTAIKGLSSAAKALDGEIGWDEAAVNVTGSVVKGAAVDVASTAVIDAVGTATAGSAIAGTAVGAAAIAAAPVVVPLAIGAFLFSLFDD